MVSQTAKEDIEQLITDGLTPSVNDIIRLNALGLKLERNQNSAISLFNAPRIAWLGDVVLYQPTLGHEIWLEDVENVMDMADPATNLAVTTFACSFKDSSKLPDAFDKPTLYSKLASFKKQISSYTPQQILAAAKYVVDGNDANLYENAPTTSKEPEIECEAFSIPTGILLNGIATGIGMSIGDALKLTRGQFETMVRHYQISNGMLDIKVEKQEASGGYFDALAEIRERLQNEVKGKSNGK